VSSGDEQREGGTTSVGDKRGRTGGSARVQRWRAAFDPKWFAGIVSALVITAFAGLWASLQPESEESKVADGGAADVQDASAERPLRVAVTRTDPQDFKLAFRRDIGLPSETTGWKELVKRGGLDVGSALLRLTLANRSRAPLAIRDIRLEITRVDPAPRGSLAFVHTQGSGSVAQYAARIEDPTPNSTVRLYRTMDPPDEPYFDEKYISLEPGEIYEAKVTLSIAPSTRAVRYRIVISGSTPTREFVVKNVFTGRLSGLDDNVDGAPRYLHHYVSGYLGYLFSTGMCPDILVKRWFAAPGPLDSTCPSSAKPNNVTSPDPSCAHATVDGVRVIRLARTFGCELGGRLAASVVNAEGYRQDSQYYCRWGQGGTSAIQINGHAYIAGFCYRKRDRREVGFLARPIP